MDFEVIPAIDLKQGRCVQLAQGRRDHEIVSLDNPVAIAEKWIGEGAEILHIIDLDSAFQLGRNVKIIKQIMKLARVQIGGGIRSYEDAAFLLGEGADRIILGTAAIKDPELIRNLSNEFSSDRIMVALDVKRGKVAIDGWTHIINVAASELASKLEKYAGSFLYTNIDVEGRLKGIDTEPIIDLVRSVNLPVIVSGGITSMNDIKLIKEAGAKGVVIGSALYKRKISLSDAIKQFSGGCRVDKGARFRA